MVGFNIFFSKEIDKEMEKHYSIKNLIKYNDRFEFKELYKNDRLIISFNSYEEYPCKIIENKKLIIILEGLIYNTNNIEGIAGKIITNINDMVSIKKIIHSLDGEFVFIIINKKSNILYIINNLLGQLPCYYKELENGFVISRDISYILGISHSDMDMKSICQYLFFRFPLQNRTLFKNIWKIHPASINSINLDTGEFRTNIYYGWNLEELQKSKKINTSQIQDTFLEACNNRINSDQFKNYSNHFGLTGGFDSRAVLFGMKKAWKNINFYTYYKNINSQNEKLDLEVAEKLSKEYNLTWEKKKLKAFQLKEIDQIIKIKNGLSLIELGHIINFFKGFYNNNNKKGFNYITGDTGYSIRPLYKIKNIKKIEDFKKIIFSIDERFFIFHSMKLSNACFFTGIDRELMLNELMDLFKSYPEKSMKLKFQHFFLEHYIINWHYEGMDRNRNFGWLFSPLESVQMMYNSYIINPRRREKFSLYKEFLLSLNNESLEEKISNFDVQINSTKGKLLLKYFDIKKKIINHTKIIINRIIPKKIKKKLFKNYRSENIYGIEKLYKKLIERNEILNISKDYFPTSKIEMNTLCNIFRTYEIFKED